MSAGEDPKKLIFLLLSSYLIAFHTNKMIVFLSLCCSFIYQVYKMVSIQEITTFIQELELVALKTKMKEEKEWFVFFFFISAACNILQLVFCYACHLVTNCYLGIQR